MNIIGQTNAIHLHNVNSKASSNKSHQEGDFQVDVSKFRARANDELTSQVSSEDSKTSLRVSTQEDIEIANKRELNFVRLNWGEFKSIVDDTSGVVEQEKQNYEVFLKEANDVIRELKTLDSTGKLEIVIDIDGFAKVSIKPGQIASDKTHEDKEKIEKALHDRTDEIKAISQKGYKYAIAKSIQYYENATGINFNNMHQQQSRVTSGMANAIAGQHSQDSQRTTEYLAKMHRYASWAFSTKPKSFQEINEMGNPLNAPFSPNQSKTLLPNY